MAIIKIVGSIDDVRLSMKDLLKLYGNMKLVDIIDLLKD